MKVLAASVVDTHAVLQLLWVSLVAGVGVTAAFSLAILGFTRASELAGSARIGFAAVGVIAFAACAGAIALGVLLLTQ